MVGPLNQDSVYTVLHCCRKVILTSKKGFPIDEAFLPKANSPVLPSRDNDWETFVEQNRRNVVGVAL